MYLIYCYYQHKQLYLFHSNDYIGYTESNKINLKEIKDSKRRNRTEMKRTQRT